MKKIISILLILIMATGFAGCTKTSGGSDKLQVYTSFYAMYDFARMIAGDVADVYLMCPPGSEPHDYEPKTTDMAKLSGADMFIYNGGGMEHWAQKISESLGGVEIVCTSDGLLSENANDPHVWLDPIKALAQMQKIRDAFIALDAENKAQYENNYEECRTKVQTLDSEMKALMADAKTNKIIVAHGAYGYLCEAYGIEQIAIENISGDSDPSPAMMAKIIDTARAEGIKYVCAEEMGSSKVVDTVAREIGAEVVSLNPFEGAADNETYFEAMNENIEVLKRILN